VRGVSRAERTALELLGSLKGEFVSRRDGHVIIKYRDGDKTAIAWVRQRPITREALELFKRIVKKHEYDRLVLIKTYSTADYVDFSSLDLFDEVKTVTEIPKELSESGKTQEEKTPEKKDEKILK